jgi:hypothetical protein
LIFSMENKQQRGRPRTTLPDYPLQATKMAQFFAYLKGLGQAETQGDLAPFFGLNSRTAFNKLFLGKKPLNKRHKEFFSLKTGIRKEWWDTKGVPIEAATAGIMNSASRNEVIRVITEKEGETITERWVPGQDILHDPEGLIPTLSPTSKAIEERKKEGISIEELKDTSYVPPPNKERSGAILTAAQKEQMRNYLLDMQGAINDTLTGLPSDTEETDSVWQTLREIDAVMRRAQRAIEELDARGRDMMNEEHEELLAAIKAIRPALDSLIPLLETARGAQADFFRFMIARNRKRKSQAVPETDKREEANSETPVEAIVDQKETEHNYT